MIRIVTPENRHYYKKQLQDMFQMRARVAVEEMNWNIPVCDNGMDIDEFDYPDTVYILYFNDDGEVSGCARLNPTNRPNLISEVFPQLCEGKIPNCENIHEFSRYLIERRGKTQRQYSKTWLLIGQSVNEYCLSRGIKQVITLSRKRMYQMSTSVWKTRPLGFPKYFEDDEKTYQAGISNMNEDGLKNLQKYTKIKSSLLNFGPPPVKQVQKLRAS